MHDSFIRPTTTVLNTRNNLNRERNILTKNEKRKFKIYEKENVPIKLCEDNKNVIESTLIGKENTLSEHFDSTAEDFEVTKEEGKDPKQFLTRQKSNNEHYLKTFNQVLNFPVSDSDEIIEEKCKKLNDIEHTSGVKAFAKTESESDLKLVEKGKVLILNLSQNKNEDINEERCCDNIETELFKSFVLTESIECSSLNIAGIHEVFVQHSEAPLENFVPFKPLKSGLVVIEEETNLIAALIEKEILFNHDYSIPKRPERVKKEAKNNNRRINILTEKPIDGFIHNNLKDADVNDAHVFDSDSDEDELPNLEFVDKNILMQEELLKRNEVDRKKLHFRKKYADKLTNGSNLESDNLKSWRHEILNYDTNKKPSKARSRLISPSNKKDRTIEKEYSVYKTVIHTEKSRKTNINNNHGALGNSRMIVNDEKSKYKERNININLSCNSTGSQCF